MSASVTGVTLLPLLATKIGLKSTLELETVTVIPVAVDAVVQFDTVPVNVPLTVRFGTVNVLLLGL